MEEFVRKHEAHYSPEGNGALARCLAPLIVQLLPGLDNSRVETQ